VAWLMLSHQKRRDPTRETATRLTSGVNHVPGLIDLLPLKRICLHSFHHQTTHSRNEPSSGTDPAPRPCVSPLPAAPPGPARQTTSHLSFWSRPRSGPPRYAGPYAGGRSSL